MAGCDARAEGAAPRDAAALQCAKRALLCIAYISVSTLLIRFNKKMMQDDHFPFAMALSAIHMLTSSLLCGLLYALAPSMFPAMDATLGHRHELLRLLVPIGALFAIMLYGSNQAYAYCSVALLQFMKEANVMVVFLMSCAAGLQAINRLRVALIIWVITGAAISVSGDMHFSLVGVAFQVASQLAECARVVLGEIVLSGRNLDPLTYTFFVAPICFLVLVVATVCSWDQRIIPALVAWWPLLLLNALVAFVLNVLVATVIKEFSAVGFTLTGLTKDIVIVALSWLMFAEPVTALQWGTFSMTLGGVGLWSLMKLRPRSAPVQFLEQALCMPQREAQDDGTAEERARLIGRKV